MMYGRFASLYDTFMSEVDYGNWCDYIIKLLSRRGVTAGARVLDAACGTGNATVPLAASGFTMTGADASEDMLRIASEKARRAGVTIPFVCQELTRLSMHRPQDAVICVCDGVNYLVGLDLARAFFQRVHGALKPGGAFLFDISSRQKLENTLAMNTFASVEKNSAYIWQNVYDDETKLIEMDLTFFSSSDGKSYERFEERHIQRAHEADELTKLLKSCGFVDIEVFDAFTQDAPKPESERLQFSAARE